MYVSATCEYINDDDDVDDESVSVCVCIGIDVNMPTDKSGLFCNAANYVVTDAIFRSPNGRETKKREEKKKKKRKIQNQTMGIFISLFWYTLLLCVKI